MVAAFQRDEGRHLQRVNALKNIAAVPVRFVVDTVRQASLLPTIRLPASSARTRRMCRTLISRLAATRAQAAGWGQGDCLVQADVATGAARAW